MPLFFPFIAILSVSHPTGSNSRSAKKWLFFALWKKWYYRCLSICLLLLFHIRGTSQVPEKKKSNPRSSSHGVRRLDETFLVASCLSTRKKETNAEQSRQQSSPEVEHRAKQLKNCYAPHLLEVDYIKDLLFLSSAHSLLHHSIPYEFSHPCCPSQGIFPPPTVQTLVPFSGNNWPVGWSCCPASLCYLLDVLSSGTLEPLSIRIWRSLHHGVCIVFSVFDDDDGYKRGQTSRPVVGAEVQTNCNFEAHIYHCSYHLDFGYCLFYMGFTWWPYNYFAPSHNYTTLPAYFTCIIHKDFSHSQISSGSGRRSRSTTAEPTKCTEHSSIQKSSV